MGICLICGDEKTTISSLIGVCLSCIREKPERAIELTDKIHAETRAAFSLPLNLQLAGKGSYAACAAITARLMKARRVSAA